MMGLVSAEPQHEKLSLKVNINSDNLDHAKSKERDK
jgi:hypothetical protein